MLTRIRDDFLRVSLFIVVIALWFYTTNFTDTPESLIPSMSSVIIAARDLIDEGALQKDLTVSILRVLKGFGVSTLLGITLGTLMGMSKTIYKIFVLPTTAIRQIPMVAWIPLIILWCGIGELTKTVVIVLAAFFPIMTNTFSGISETSENFIEVARLYKMNKWNTFTKVYLPHALPQILVGLKLGLGTAWMAVVAAELLASSSGIGYRLSRSRSLMRSDIVIMCMLLIGIIGIVMDKGISLIFAQLTPWNKTNK